MVDDVVESNSLLYAPGEQPDHVVVIKYVPYVGDSKRAMDEYTSELLFGGRHTLVIHNTCEDSLLAAPLLLDLVVLAEFSTRVSFRPAGSQDDFVPFHSVLALLSYLVKAPLVPKGEYGDSADRGHPVPVRRRSHRGLLVCRHPRGQLAVPAARVHRERAARVRGPRPGQQHTAGAQAGLQHLQRPQTR